MSKKEKSPKKPFSKKKKIIIAVVLVLVVLLVVFGLKSCGGAAAGVPVSTFNLEQKSLAETINLKAPLAGIESVEVASRLHYEVDELKVAEGDRVQAGQVLALLDTADLTSQLNEAQAAYTLAESQYADSLAENSRNYNKSRDNLRTAQTDYDRTKLLYDQGAVAQTELENAAAKLADAKREVAVYSLKNGKVTGSNSAHSQLIASKSALEQKQKQLQEATIKSPISGTVTRVNVKVGRFADDTEDKKPMFVIENLDKLQMEVAVSEYDIGKISIGQQVKVTADILAGEQVEAVVSRISPTGEARGVDSKERVIPTQITLTGTNDKLISGITAKAQIVIAAIDNAFVVPMGAVLQNVDQTTSVVAVLPNNTLHLIPIEVGIESDIETQISGEGLTAEMVLVGNPTAAMTEGMPCSPIPAEGLSK